MEETKEEGFSGCVDIGERLWPYLGEKARKLVNTGIRNCAIQFDRGEDGEIYQLKPIWAQEPSDRPPQKYTREVHSVMTLAKVVEFDKPIEELPEEWVRRFGLLVDKLAEADKIAYGVLGPPSTLRLKTIEDKYRLMIMLYVFSDLSLEDLNEWLDNEALVEEGGLGTTDWTNLPE